MVTASLQSQGYLPVATATLCPSAVIDCDLFVQQPGRQYAELYRASSYPIEIRDIEKLREDGIDRLYIRGENAEAYRSYLCQHVLRDKGVPLATRVQALREVTRVVFQEALTANDLNQLVNVAGPFGGDLATIVTERSMPFRDLFSTLEHDFQTFTHVCNVSI